MKIQDEALVSIHYTLKLDDGEIVDSSEGEPLAFVFGTGQVVPGLEKGLLGTEEGHKAEVVVEPAEGYGVADPGLKRDLPRADFPEGADIQEGVVFQAHTAHGAMAFRVASVTDERVSADFNHPLAGQRLHFDIEVAEVRKASEAEVVEARSGGCGSCCSGCESPGEHHHHHDHESCGHHSEES